MDRSQRLEQIISGSRLFSVGHSNHSMDDLVHLLQSAGVTGVADVRSRPYSSRLPQFSWPELETALRERDIVYVFLGNFLGGRPEHMSLYDAEGRVDYERVRGTSAFQRGIDTLLEGIAEHRIAMLCAEEDPLDCHRGLMIAPALVERGFDPLHLRGNGDLETTDAMELRLLAKTGVGAGIVDGLFAATLSRDERQHILAEAYRQMARRKAYRMPSTAPDV